MLNKRKLAVLLLFSIILMSSISAICAADSNATDIQTADSEIELKQSDSNVNDIQAVDNEQSELTDSNQKNILADGTKSYSDLNRTINNNTDSVIVLNDDYAYDNAVDSAFLGGITIKHNVTIDGNGHTINGSSKAGGFYTSHTVILKNIKFVHCGDPDKTSSNLNYGDQAVRADYDVDYGYSDVDVINCTFDYCQSGEGGAIYGVTATNCTFTNCRAQYGGATFDCDVYNCRFINNHATCSGGAMEYGLAYDSYFEGNVAEGTNSGTYKDGGGAILHGTSNNCTFIRNSAKYGGALFLDYSYNPAINSTFIGNTATQDGGAIYVTNNAATIIDCIFEQNKASHYGGAIYSATSKSTTVCCRYTGNTASSASYSNTYQCNSYSPSFFISSPLEVHYPNVAVPINITYSYNYYQYQRVYNFKGINVTLKIYNYSNYNLIGTESVLSGSLWNNSLDLGKYSISLSASVYGSSIGKSFIYTIKGYASVITLSSPTLNVSSSVFNVVKGNETYLIVNLTDEAGHPLEGLYIKVTRAEHFTKRYQTDENGQAMIPLHTFDLPEYQGSSYYLTVQSEQSGLYEASAAVGFNLYIRKANVIIDSIQSADVFYYKTLNITADIYDELGKVLSNTNVSVSFNGENRSFTTDENGRITIHIPNMEPGNYVIGIILSESDSYMGATKNIDVHIMKHLNLVTSQNVSAFCNEGKITAKLTDEFGNPIAYSDLFLNLDYFNETLTTNGRGEVEFSLEGLAEGNYSAEIRSGENETHESTTAIINVYIYRLDSSINSGNIAYVYGRSGILTAYLKDSNGNPIQNADLRLDIGSVHETLRTNAKGQVDFDLSTKLLPDKFEGSIYFDLTNRYRASSFAVNVTVSKVQTALSANDVTCTYDEGKYLVATLRDNRGNPLANEEITIKFDVRTLTGTTDSSGQARFLIDLAPRSYAGEVIFSGSDILMPSSSSVNVVVKQINVKIPTAFAAYNLKTVYNDGKYMTITLRDNYGNGIEDMQVVVKFNGKTVGYITDAKGQVKIATSALVPKTYTGKVSFSGDYMYQGASLDVKLVVKKAKPVLSASKKKFGVKSAKKYKVTLKANKKVAMKKAKLYLKVKGKTYTAKTNNNGQTTFNLKKLVKKGTYKATVTYNGNNCYNKVVKTVKIIIK